MTFQVNRGARLGMAVLCAAFVAACGGGGGDSGPPFTIHADVASVDVTQVQYDGSAMPALKISYTGTPPAVLYVAGTTDIPAILYVTAYVDDPTTQIDLQLDGAQPLGDQNGTLTIKVCADAACAHPIGGTPLLIPVHVHTVAGVTVAPDALTVDGVSGQTTTAHVDVTPGYASLGFQVGSTGADWLVAAPPDASSFELDFGGTLPAGTYLANVMVTSGRWGTTLPVTYVVAPPPGGEHNLAVSTPPALATAEGGSAAADLTVSAPTWGPALTQAVTYAPGRPAGWLTVTSTDTGYHLAADASSLKAGTYTATLTVSGDRYTTPYTGNVVLTVGAGLAALPDRTIALGAESTPADLAFGVPLPVQQGVPEAWTATSDATWLVVDTASGTTGDTLALHVPVATEAGFGNRSTRVAHVTVTPTHTGFTPVSFAVTLDKQLPAIRYVGPSTLVSGAARTVHVRGSGFASASNLLQHVSVSGVTGFGVTPVNDTQFDLVLPAVAAGTATVSISNALGESEHAATVAWIDPVDRAYAHLPYAGAKAGLVFDPVRQTFYTTTEGLVTSFHWGGSSWSRKSGGPGGNSVGLSPDRSSLVSPNSNLIFTLSPDTLNIQNTYSMPNGAMLWPQFSAGVMVGNDGRVWFANGEITSTSLWTLDLVTGTFAAAPLATNRVDTYGGQWGVMSRDGNRAVMAQSYSAGKPRLYVDEVDGVVRADPTLAWNSFLMGALDDEGTRFLDDAGRLTDAAFNPIATLDMSRRGAYALSPAGDRAYVLHYPTGWPDVTGPSSVTVYDTSRTTGVTVLGSFDVADSAGCPDGCGAIAPSLVTLDGRTLIVADYQALLVVPIPAAYRSTGSLAAARHANARPARALAPTPWVTSGPH
jgi:hypothetical protein